MTLILNIIESQDWSTFNEIALHNPKAFTALSDIMSNSSEFNGMSFLHAVVRNTPPLGIVAEIIRICPDSPSARDCLNRTPLHVAAGVGTSVPVIKYLAMAYPKPARSTTRMAAHHFTLHAM